MSGLPDLNWVDVEESYSLTCTVDEARPKVRVLWVIDGDIQWNTDQGVGEPDEDGIVSVVGTWTHKFDQDAEKQLVKCQVNKDVSSEKIYEETYTNVDVYCE